MSGFTQSKNDTVFYKPVINDPNDIPFLTISIKPIDLNMGGTGFLLGGGAGVSANITERISLGGKIATTYTQKIYNSSHPQSFLSDDAINFEFANPNDETIIVTQDLGRICLGKFV